jgi:hypothetical protein
LNVLPGVSGCTLQTLAFFGAGGEVSTIVTSKRAGAEDAAQSLAVSAKESPPVRAKFGTYVTEPPTIVASPADGGVAIACVRSEPSTSVAVSVKLTGASPRVVFACPLRTGASLHGSSSVGTRAVR